MSETTLVIVVLVLVAALVAGAYMLGRASALSRNAWSASAMVWPGLASIAAMRGSSGVDGRLMTTGFASGEGAGMPRDCATLASRGAAAPQAPPVPEGTAVRA